MLNYTYFKNTWSFIFILLYLFRHVDFTQDNSIYLLIIYVYSREIITVAFG